MKGETRWLPIPLILEGQKISKGLALGVTFLHRDEEWKANPEGAASLEAELARLHQALQALQKEIEGILHGDIPQFATDARDIITAYSFLAKDPSWRRQLEFFIQQGHCCEQAVSETLDRFQDKFSAYPFWQQRFHDLKDISQQLRKHLGHSFSEKIDETKDLIVVAKMLSVADLLLYMRYNIKGLILEDVAPTSHAMILACSLGIPIIGGISKIFEKIDNDTPVIVDANAGTIHLRPTHTLLHRVRERLDSGKQAPMCVSKDQATEPLLSADKISIELYINVNLAEDMFILNEPFIKGVGLFRTELPFMLSNDHPSIEIQQDFYTKIFNLSKKHPIIVRTLDVAPDKLIPGLSVSQKNHAKNIKSNRVVRLLLDHPDLIQNQICAILQAHDMCDYPHQPLHIMLPMIAEIDEFSAIRNLIDREIKQQRKKGLKDFPIKIGSMIEVPSILFQLDVFFSRVDFASVGTNDLFQFLYAIDREHMHQHSYDVLSPLFLGIMKNLISTAKKYGKELSVCGEIASRPLEAMVLLGLGLEKLSVSPANVYAVAGMIRSLPLEKFRSYLSEVAYLAPCASTVRDLVLSFVQKNGVFIEA
jgi:phosphotransferase system enzyme I (PtsP)